MNSYRVWIGDKSDMSFIASNIKEIHQTLQKCLHFPEVVETNTSRCVDHNRQIKLRLTDCLVDE